MREKRAGRAEKRRPLSSSDLLCFSHVTADKGKEERTRTANELLSFFSLSFIFSLVLPRLPLRVPLSPSLFQTFFTEEEEEEEEKTKKREKEEELEGNKMFGDKRDGERNNNKEEKKKSCLTQKKKILKYRKILHLLAEDRWRETQKMRLRRQIFQVSPESLGNWQGRGNLSFGIRDLTRAVSCCMPSTSLSGLICLSQLPELCLFFSFKKLGIEPRRSTPRHTRLPKQTSNWSRV